MIYFLTVLMFIFALIGISYTILGKNFFFSGPNAYSLKIFWDFELPLVPLNELADKKWNNKLLRLCFFHVRLLRFFKIMIILQLVFLSISAIFLPSTISQNTIRIVDLFATNPSSQPPPIFIVLYLIFILIYILLLIFSWVYIDFIDSEAKKIKDEIESYVPE